jgi:hypothetical protein
MAAPLRWAHHSYGLPPQSIPRDYRGMLELSRRRSTDAREECWHIYYGDVHVGTIAIRSGNPHDEDPWEWYCGFYPGPDERRAPRFLVAMHALNQSLMAELNARSHVSPNTI